MADILVQLLPKLETSYIVLLVLLVIDTMTDVAGAIRASRFTMRDFARLASKIVTYTVAVLVLLLLEIGLFPIWRMTILSEIMVTFLSAIETFGVLDNLALLGVPIPANLVTILIKNLKIPGLSQALKAGVSGERGLQEIDEILEHQIPSFHEADIRQLLQINCEVWRGVALQINNLAPGNNGNQKDLLFYKVMSLIEVGFREIDERVREAGISEENLRRFRLQHQPRVDKWLAKVKEICYAEGPGQGKQPRLLDSLIAFLYQIIMESLQVFNGAVHPLPAGQEAQE